MSANFRRKGGRLLTTVGITKLVIALSCGIKISANDGLVLSQSTRVSDRRTDRELRQVIPRSIAARAVKSETVCGIAVNCSHCWTAALTVLY